MIELLVKVENGRLVGATASDAETLVAVEGESFTCRLTGAARKRSLTQLQLWWSVCGLIAENFDADGYEMTKEHVSRVLKVGAGHADVIPLHDGSFQYQERSIAFNKLKQEDFNAVMDKAMTVAANKFGPALAHAARLELDKMLSGEPKESRL